MQIEVSEQTRNELHRRAQAAGVEIGAYLDTLLRTAGGVAKAEPPTVEEWQAMLKQSNATSGRDGRPWREYIHEGHKY